VLVDRVGRELDRPRRAGIRHGGGDLEPTVGLVGVNTLAAMSNGAVDRRSAATSADTARTSSGVTRRRVAWFSVIRYTPSQRIARRSGARRGQPVASQIGIRGRWTGRGRRRTSSSR
jgi:hypothetical protein